MTQDAKTAARTSTADHIARFISQLKDGWSIGLKGPKGSHSHYGSQEFRDAVISALSALQDGEATEGAINDLLTKLWFIAGKLEPSVREDIASIIVALRAALTRKAEPPPVAPTGKVADAMIEAGARAICVLAGDNPNAPVYSANGLKRWQLHAADAKAVLEAALSAPTVEGEGL